MILWDYPWCSVKYYGVAIFLILWEMEAPFCCGTGPKSARKHLDMTKVWWTPVEE
jgi:hypothetical protein